jgi:predicted nucleic acid-binding protein
MIVVSDTTPLRSLAVLGEMALLPRLFGEVSIPMAVLDECRHPSAPASPQGVVVESPRLDASG